MGQSLVKNYVHIIFSTKLRKPLISESIENELFTYVGGICRELECPAIIVGGYLDHVHILVFLSKKVALATLIQKVKAKYIKNQKEHHQNISFQDEYLNFLNQYNIEYNENYVWD